MQNNNNARIYEIMKTALLWADAQFPIEYGSIGVVFAMVPYDIRESLQSQGFKALMYIKAGHYGIAIKMLIDACAEERRGMHNNEKGHFLCYQNSVEILATVMEDDRRIIALSDFLPKGCL